MKVRIKAFTLLECLVALLVISGSLLVVDGLSKHLSSEVKHIDTNEEVEWQLFCSLLRQELDSGKFIKVEDNFLYLKQKEVVRLGQASTSDNFRKTNINGQGFQPMIFNIKSSKIYLENDLLHIRLIFNSGREKVFISGVEDD